VAARQTAMTVAIGNILPALAHGVIASTATLRSGQQSFKLLRRRSLTSRERDGATSGSAACALSKEGGACEEAGG